MKKLLSKFKLTGIVSNQFLRNASVSNENGSDADDCNSPDDCDCDCAC